MSYSKMQCKLDFDLCKILYTFRHMQNLTFWPEEHSLRVSSTMQNAQTSKHLVQDLSLKERNKSSHREQHLPEYI